MALKAGRVGVAKDQVDEFGKITGGSTPENVYTKTQCDNKFETKTHANNTYQPKTIEVPLELLGGSQLTVETSLHAIEETFGNLRFRNNDGTPQVKTPSGDWTNFNSGGGGGIGFNIPSDLLMSATPGRASCTITGGGYAVVDGIIYVDVTFIDTSSGATGSLIQCPLPEGQTVSNTAKISMYTDVVNSYNAGCNLTKGTNTRVDIAVMNSGLSANVEHRAYGQFVLNPV